MKMKVTTEIKGWDQPLVENIHDWVNLEHLKTALGKRGVAELLVTGKHVREDGISIVTYELIKENA